MKGVIYSTADGGILRTFEGPETTVENQRLGSDEAILTENDVSSWPASLEDREVDPSTETFRWAMDLSTAKQERVAEVKERAQEVLLETDWYVVREQETGEAIPQDVLDHRSAVRSKSDTFEQEINDLGTVDDVMGYSYTFPSPP